MRVQVTQDDIDLGMPGNACDCPLALAISRAAGQDWRVGLDIAWRVDDGLQITLPKVASDFRPCFDRGGKVSPFEFEVHEQ